MYFNLHEQYTEQTSFVQPSSYPFIFETDFQTVLFENDFKAIFPELFLVLATIFLLLYGVIYSTSSETKYQINQTYLNMTNPEQAEFLHKTEISEYMAIVGGLIWISGLRLDITFATMYLAWNTKMPRKHHLRMAKNVLIFLNTTKDLPLVLGGSSELIATTYTDASLGTAPRGRSVVSNMTKLNDKAGAVSAQTKATNVVFISSFKTELDGAT